jgi:hypothetical protein
MPVTMIAVGMVQFTVDEIVDMIAMRHGLMAATRSMGVTRTGASGSGIHAARRVGGGHRQLMLVIMDDAPINRMWVVQVAVVQVVDVSLMLDRGMAALATVFVVVSGVVSA